MTHIVVFLGRHRGALPDGSAHLLSTAANVGRVTAVLAVEGQVPETLAEELAALGASSVLVGLADPTVGLTPEVALLAAAVEHVDRPDAVLTPSTVDGREIAARTAIRINGSYHSDVVDLSLNGGRILARHEVFGGSYSVQSTGTRGVPVLSLRSAAVQDEPARSSGTVSVEMLTVDPMGSATAFRLSGDLPESTGELERPALGSATIVVSGGRGMGTAENFLLVGDLADALGGAVGASRAAVEAGFCAREAQVGQTGAMVSPKVYIALGISGALQHRMGMQTADRIVAVNKDPEAPIFELADLGIVGDVTTVVPQLIDALRAAS